MKYKIDKKFIKLAVIVILTIFLTSSANSAIVNNKDNILTPPKSTLYENYYEWKDDFNNEQLIDSGNSFNYLVENGKAKMIDTFPIWTDPEWERMKPIELTSDSNYNSIAIYIEVIYDSDMKSDFGDIRFKYEGYTGFRKYWMEDYQPSSWAKFWVLIPEIDSGTSMLYMFYKNSGAYYEGNFGDVFTDWEEEWANDNQITTLKQAEEGCWDPDISYNADDDEFLVCWEQGMPYWYPYLSGFRQEIKASIYEPDGDILVSEKIVFKDSGVDYWRNENPSIAYGTDSWFVAWDHWKPNEKNPPATTKDIYARTVKRSGSSLDVGTVRVVTDDGACQNTIQADANVEFDSVNEKFMVVWEDGRDGTSDYDIWARLYTSAGAPTGDEERLCNDVNSQCEPWAAYDPNNEQYFIVWEDGVNAATGPFRIKGGLYDSDLNTISTFTVAEPTGYPNDDLDYNFPCVEFDIDSERFLVTWNEADISDGVYRGDILGKIYDTSGNVKVNTFTISTGSFERSDIVPYLSEAFFVAYDNQANVYGQLVTSEGNLLGSGVQMSTSPSAKADWVNLDTDGSEIFAAWEDTRITYYPERYDFFPDVFGNLLNLNIPSGDEVTYEFWDEKQFISEAQITSIDIEPDNLEKWHQFLEESTETITFSILDDNYNVIPGYGDINSGQDLSTINPTQYPLIKLKAFFTRTDPTYTPTLDSWTILYEGLDLDPPVTTVTKIDGDFAPNHNWYKSENVTIWLKAVDYPEDTGSGIDKTYYTLNGGEEKLYNEASGIDVYASEPDFFAIVEVNFWSVDNSGNIEDRTKAQNYRTIRIDARPPYVIITSPENEEKVQTPFLVTADATDNYEVAYVEFDIEPFGKRPGLPWKDETPPWEWLCNVKPMSRDIDEIEPRGVNVMIRAQVYDVTGQTWIDENWIYISNWNSRDKQTKTYFKTIFESIKLAIAIGDTLDIEIPTPDNADLVEFNAKRMFRIKEEIISDIDFSDGCSAKFDVPTGFYKIKTTTYKEEEEIDSKLVYRVLFINL